MRRNVFNYLNIFSRKGCPCGVKNSERRSLKMKTLRVSILLALLMASLIACGPKEETSQPTVIINVYPGGAIGEVETTMPQEEPEVTLTTNSKSYTYNVGEDSSIWMSGDEGLETWKLHGGEATLVVPEGYEVKVFASAGVISGPEGQCNLGNPISCEGKTWLKAGTYTFQTDGENQSAGIKVDVRED